MLLVLFVVILSNYAYGASCRYTKTPSNPGDLIGKVVEWKENGISGYAVITNAWSPFGDSPTYGRGSTHYYGAGLYYFGQSLVYAFSLKPGGDPDNDAAYCYIVSVSSTNSQISYVDILDFKAEPQSIAPYNGETTILSWLISSSSNTNWSLSIAGRTFSGTDTSTMWDGRDGDGKVVSSGIYIANLIVKNSEGCSDSRNLSIKVDVPIQPCDLIIDVTKQTIKQYVGGTINIGGKVTDSSGKPITWEITLPNGEVVQGAGDQPSAPWNGKDASGKLVEPGSYSATITADNGDGCSDTATVPITVTTESDGNSCSLKVQIGSSANVANGNLSHSQDLFSSRGSALPLGMTLYYNSLDPINGSLGLGWSHEYDISLTENSDGSVLLKEGNWHRRLYTYSGGTYSAQPQDYSTLVKNSDNTFVLTHKDGLKYTFNSDGTLA